MDNHDAGTCVLKQEGEKNEANVRQQRAFIINSVSCKVFTEKYGIHVCPLTFTLKQLCIEQ